MEKEHITVGISLSTKMANMFETLWSTAFPLAKLYVD